MTVPCATCPNGLTQQNYSNIAHPLCNRAPGNYCDSTFFSTQGQTYSKICGRVRGYQFGDIDSFISIAVGIDNMYIEGVSITHGRNPRQHIWTYAAAITEDDLSASGCPCSTGYAGGINIATTFVGSHYYCESGIRSHQLVTSVLYPNDTLWDGQQCNGPEAPCCQGSSTMPWFYRSLGTHTSDDIELRLCGGHDGESTPLDIIELYVK